ncbi:MAG: GNAT family N-acetyltransferase [Acidimicrobiales bacterium]
MEIRLVRPDEFDTLGKLTLAVYTAVDHRTVETDDGYDEELADVGRRAADADVLVAVDGDGLVLGGVTFVPGPESSSAEFTDPGTAGIRMLAVAESAQGRGVGEALVQACIARALAAGKHRIALHSTDRMTVAHRLYTRLGFTRDESADWQIIPGFTLLGFRLDL